MKLDQLRSLVEGLGGRISVPTDSMPTYGFSEDAARPHIEVDPNGLFHYVVVERGVELRRDKTNNLDELLFWVFSDITFDMACNFEVKNRIESQDFRIRLFDNQEELLGLLNPKWAEVMREKHEKLIYSPSDETKQLRKERHKNLCEQGLNDWDAWVQTCEEHPSGRPIKKP